ncbi:hypothetical protein ACFX2A_021945 [Malus domestica]
MGCGDQIPTNETVRRHFIIQQRVWLFLHTQPPTQLAIYLFMVNFSLVSFIAFGSTCMDLHELVGSPLILSLKSYQSPTNLSKRLIPFNQLGLKLHYFRMFFTSA